MSIESEMAKLVHNEAVPAIRRYHQSTTTPYGTRPRLAGVTIGVFAALFGLLCVVATISDTIEEKSNPGLYAARQTMRNAEVACIMAVKDSAKYDLRWIDGMTNHKMRPDYRENTHRFIFRGDAAEAKNFLGNWIRVNYECEFDIGTNEVIRTVINPGRN